LSSARRPTSGPSCARSCPCWPRERSERGSYSRVASERACASSPAADARARRKPVSAASPLSTATDTRSGRAPAGPERFQASELLVVLKRAGSRFLEDDCMGLAQQVAYSSLLAFFPAVIFLVGLLGLIGAYDQLQSFLNPIAPRS